MAGEGAHQGRPDDARSWEVRQLGHPVEPDTWHRLRLWADFGTLGYGALEIETGGRLSKIDFRGVPMSCPNPIPIDLRAMRRYVHAVSVAPIVAGAGSEVLFDDLSGAVWSGSGWVEVCREGFDTPADIPEVPAKVFRLTRAGFPKPRYTARTPAQGWPAGPARAAPAGQSWPTLAPEACQQAVRMP